MVRGSQIPTILNHPQQPFSGGRRALSASNLLTWGISLQHPLLPSCRTGFTRCFSLDKPLCSTLRQCVCSPSRVLRFAACRPSELFDCGPSSCLTCQPVAPILRTARCLLSHFVERLCLCRRLLCQPRKNVAGSGKALDVCEHNSSLSHNSFVSPLTNEFRSQYGAYHHNSVNVAIHMICVPLLLVSGFALVCPSAPCQLNNVTSISILTPLFLFSRPRIRVRSFTRPAG